MNIKNLEFEDSEFADIIANKNKGRKSDAYKTADRIKQNLSGMLKFKGIDSYYIVMDDKAPLVMISKLDLAENYCIFISERSPFCFTAEVRSYDCTGTSVCPSKKFLDILISILCQSRELDAISIGKYASRLERLLVEKGFVYDTVRSRYIWKSDNKVQDPIICDGMFVICTKKDKKFIRVEWDESKIKLVNELFSSTTFGSEVEALSVAKFLPLDREYQIYRLNIGLDCVD